MAWPVYTKEPNELWDEMLLHAGHMLTVSTYVGNGNEVVDIAVECEDCGEVLMELEEGDLE